MLEEAWLGRESQQSWLRRGHGALGKELGTCKRPPRAAPWLLPEDPAVRVGGACILLPANRGAAHSGYVGTPGLCTAVQTCPGAEHVDLSVVPKEREFQCSKTQALKDFTTYFSWLFWDTFILK